MMRKTANWFSALIVAALTLTASLAGAQVGYGGGTDYSVPGGTDNRPGHNPNPANSGPGAAVLGWRSPAIGGNFATPFYVDNTDFAINNFYPPFSGGPYDFNARGSADSSPTVTGVNNPSINWGWPAFPSPPNTPNQANGAYDPIARQYPLGVLKANYTLRTPAYFMTDATPSAPLSVNPTDNPTLPENSAALRYFDWNYKWNANDPPYANIYVNIPVGATQTSPAAYSYPVEYYVFEIFYYDNLGNQQAYIEVIDTYQTGTTNVQLGLLNGSTGAFPVNQPPANGANAITVRLLNTVPRDPNTGLLLQLVNGQPIPTGMEGEVSQFLVYADATQFAPAIGSIYGTPTVASLSTGTIRTTIATNIPQGGLQNGNYVSTVTGEVVDYLYNAGETNGTFPNGGYGEQTWTYTPLENGSQVLNLAPTTYTSGFSVETGPATYQGANYLAAPVSNQLPQGTDSATYTPNLQSGSFLVYAFIPGNATGQSFATQARVDVLEGTNVTTTYVNESVAGGWVQIGTRAFNNNVNGSGALQVIIRNYSPASADAGTYVYANYVRFQGAASLSIVSSPLHTQAHIVLTPGGIPTLKDVVIAQDERGVIHCLDATGNGNGTTTEYWSYPSTQNTNANWFDPNTNPNEDQHPITGGLYDGTNGNTLAEMPTGFGYSSGLVESYPNPNAGEPGQPATLEYLFVTTTNGRVYCIAMQGRGDFNATLIQAGTTQRMWTYPATYPSASAISSSNLGAFQGSPTYGQVNGSTGALYVPTMQGRMYCLNAFPTNFDAAGNTGTTTPIWAYPAVNQPVLGPIAVTPALDSFGGNAPYPMLFFGTEMLNDNPAQFFALNANTGAVVWTYNAIADPVTGVTNPFYNFISSPCTVSGAILNATPNDTTNPINPTPNVDTVYTANSNNYIYAFNAETGVLSWQSSDLPVGVQGALSYSVVQAYNYAGGVQAFPLIMVPATTTQRFYGEFARPYDVNIVGGHLAWGSPFTLIGQSMVGSISNGDNWMYAADTGGNLYALDTFVNSSLAYESNPFNAPNSPAARAFEYTKIRTITQAEFNALAAGSQTYASGTSQAGADPRSPVAFDWGETAYIEVYDFPFSAESNSSNTNTSATSTPATANLTVSTQGYNSPTSTPQLAQQFVSGAPSVDNGVLLDGYAVFKFTFGTGRNAVAPGKGTMSITMNVTSANGQQGTVALEPGLAPVPVPAETTPPSLGWSQFGFVMANPLALEVLAPTGTNDPDQSIGKIANPQDPLSASIIGNPGSPQNGVNGSFNTAPSSGGTAGLNYSLIQATPGFPVEHNTSGQFTVNVYDRSLLGVLYGSGVGLPGVMVDRHDIVWEGNQNNIFSILPPNLFPNFEDYPNNYPNNSLDYPNISRDSLSITVNPQTAATNPLITPITLNPPLYGGQPISITNNPSGKTDRIVNEQGVATPFLFQVQVPLYQPANMGYWPLTTGSVPGPTTGATQDEFGSYALSQGYIGRLNIFVDTGGNVFQTTGQFVDAYRSFQDTVAVPPSPSMVVTTPNVDLGPVAAGQAYGRWNSNNSTFNLQATTALGTVAQQSPWQLYDPNNWGYYQFFTLENSGNVNMLNIRVAKASSYYPTNSNSLAYNTWSIPAPNNDPAGFLDAYYDVWSNMDAADSPANPNNTTLNPVIFQKARPSDTVPTALSVDPVARVNPNLNLNTAVPLLPQYPTGAAGGPSIGVTVPFGMPVGTYQQLMRVVENYPYAPNFSNEVLDQVTSTTYETYSDPSFTLSFNVTEARLTGNSTPATYQNPASLEYLTSQQNSQLAYRNVQPAAMRDPFGGLVAAFVSDRQVFAPTVVPSVVPNPEWRIYLAGMGNQTTFAQSSMTPPVNSAVPFSSYSPLFDLDWFKPATQTTWFNPSTSSTNGYPSGNTGALAGLFTGAPTGQTITNVSFGSPAFPADGMVNKLSQIGGTGIYSQSIMGFVGEAQLSANGSGAADTATSSVLSGLFLAPVQTTAVTGAVTAGNPVLVAPDYSIRKGKPAILQRSNTSALVFYPGTSANASDIYYTLFNGTTATAPYPLNFGGGFLSVDSVSASNRFLNDALTQPVVELTFGGKLRGEKSDEIFMGRLPMAQSGTGLAVDANLNPLPFLDLPAQTFEELSATSDAGVYRSRGVDYDILNAPIHLVQVTTGGTTGQAPNYPMWTNLLMDGWGDPNFQDVNGPWDQALNYNPAKNTAVVDRATGIITYDTRLGGKVYIDPALGTVRFVGGIPSQAAVIRLSYQPRFMRVSDTSGPYSSPSGLFDTRITSDPLDLTNANGNAASFIWRKADSGSKTYGDDWVSGTDLSQNGVPLVTNDRFVYTYNRGASGAGQATRPYMSTRRFGVPLQYPIYVSPNGVPGYVQVLWLINGSWQDPSPLRYYQIDPSNSKIYFEAIDEGATVKVVYQAADPTTGQLLNNQNNGLITPGEIDVVGQIQESAEAPILMNSPVNESGVDAFLDPFDYANLRRPPLMWLFWTSTRNGSPDVYMETLSPMLIPRPNGLKQ